MSKGKRMAKKKINIQEQIQQSVNLAFTKGFASVLNDIEYRIQTLYDAGVGAATGLKQRINSMDLNLASHILDGFVFTDNSPSAGYVAWTGCNIVYKGTSYAITDGNSNKKYIWWQFSGTKTVFQTTDTFPTLTDDDVLITINNGGTHTMNIGEGRATSGLAISPGTVGSSQIASGGVATSNIANNAITNALLASGAVASGNIASGAVTSGALATGAVTSAALAAGAVGSSAIASGAVTSSAIASGAVGSSAIAANAVTSTAIASGAVGNSQLAANAVQASNIASGAVGSTQIAAGAVGNSQLGAGAVASANLNLAQHLLY